MLWISDKLFQLLQRIKVNKNTILIGETIMGNEKPEADMLESFYSKFKNSDCVLIQTCKCSHTNDEFYYVRCESKVASKLNGNPYKERHNVNHKVFGEILKGRNLPSAINPISAQYNVAYGLFIPLRDIAFFKSKYNFMLSDWNAFGEHFDCLFVLVYDENSGRLDVYFWENCWANTPTPVCVYR
jgi:hypothetical protein